MKKIIILLSAILLTFTSCGSDDNSSSSSSTPSENPIVGTWKYFKHFEDNQEQTLDPCEQQESLIFTAAGDFTENVYEENTSGTCILETNIGSWSSDNLNNYTLSTGSSSSTKHIIFDEGNQFYFEGTYIDIDDNIINTKDVYIKQ